MFACLCWVIYLYFHCHDSDKRIKASVWCTAVTYVKLLLWSVLYQRIHFSFSCLAFSVSNLLVNTLLFGFAHKILDIHHLNMLNFWDIGQVSRKGPRRRHWNKSALQAQAHNDHGQHNASRNARGALKIRDGAGNVKQLRQLTTKLVRFRLRFGL
jgi:hypothetical protein